MSEAYLPPTSPPPPHVPEGWKAVWNDQYKEWFYVNLYTKASQWDRPTEPALRPTEEGGPPGYSSGPHDPVFSDTKQQHQPFDSNNPYNNNPGIGHTGETDEQLAQRLQAEEQQRASGHSPLPPGAGGAYYGQPGGYPGGPQQGGYPGGPQPGGYPGDPSQFQGQDRAGKSGGLLGKLASKLSGKSSGGGGYGGGYGGHPQPGYGGYNQGYGGGHSGGFGGFGGGHGGGYGRPGRKPGMGVGGAAALGVGGGLLGGALLANSINDGQQDSYQDGYQDGADDGGGYGSDDGGGDFGGGDGGGGE